MIEQKIEITTDSLEREKYDFSFWRCQGSNLKHFSRWNFLRCIVQDEKDKLIFNKFLKFFFFDSNHINESKHIKYFTIF